MYATPDDIVALHGAEFLLLVAARGGEESLADPLTTAAVADALAQASSEIDSYLAARLQVPVSPVPRVLQNACVNVAVYQLASTAGQMTEIIRERYKNVISWLRDVARGNATLPGGDDGAGGVLTQEAPLSAEFAGNDPLFTRGSW